MPIEEQAKSYTDLFDLRGTAYDQAMQRWPHARRQEFEQLLRMANLRGGMVVADVPAGGGYLQHYLPAGCIWLGHEPCASFTDHHASAHGAMGQDLLPLPWAEESIDLMISLAGVHHLDDKRPLFSEMHRATKQSGQLILSDVAIGSAVAHFLDDFVGRHNSTGHAGVYLDQHTAVDLQQTGWSIRSDQKISFHWVFDHRRDMADFCRGLFDIQRASDAEIWDAVDRMLGVDVMDAEGAGEEKIGMRWALRTIVAERAA